MKAVKTLMLVLVAWCAGCAQYAECWDGRIGEVTPVVISDNMSDIQVRAVTKAVKRINDTVGVPVLEIVTQEMESEFILVEDVVAFEDPEVAGRAYHSSDGCVVAIKDSHHMVVVHELLHCLGFEHVDDDTDIMNPWFNGESEIKPYVAEDLRARF